MYAFRKPFTVATYAEMSYWGMNYKIILIIAQVLGYMLSKFIGIKLISELKSRHRFSLLVLMIGIASMSLLGFAIIPAPWNVVCMFFNGLPLGVVWGIVFSYLEGRKTTEILGVALCSSFIVSSGAVKSVGLLSMNWLGVNEFWMPFTTAMLFLLPFLGFALLLERIPSPTQEDVVLKAERSPMNATERLLLLKEFLIPIIVLVLFYTGLTALRDYRDNFSRELWDAVGFAGNVSVYTYAEVPIALLVLLILGCFVFIKNSYRVFVYYHYLLVVGAVVLGASTLLFQINVIGPVLWMIVVGFGLYICYVPFNCIFFDRMMAAFKLKGNAGYLIYIADSFGYLGSIVILLYKNFVKDSWSWLNFFIYGCYIIAFIGLLATFVSLGYFKYKNKQAEFQNIGRLQTVD